MADYQTNKSGTYPLQPMCMIWKSCEKYCDRWLVAHGLIFECSNCIDWANLSHFSFDYSLSPSLSLSPTLFAVPVIVTMFSKVSNGKLSLQPSCARRLLLFVIYFWFDLIGLSVFQINNDNNRFNKIISIKIINSIIEKFFEIRPIAKTDN